MKHDSPHQQPFPSNQIQPEIQPVTRDVCRSARCCQQFHTPSGFPQHHVARRVTLHSGRNSQLRSPLGTAPYRPRFTILPGLLQIFPRPRQRAAQNNRTHQHFHLHPRASSDTAAAAVRALAGRLLKSTECSTSPHPLSDTSTDRAMLGSESHTRCG